MARTRTARQKVLDTLVTRVQGLRSPTTDYVVERDLQIPMRDGVTLLADLYAPTGASSGTVMLRSPYGFGSFVAALTGGVFASRGYHVLLARCRGTFGSGGEFEPFVNEVEDAADTVAWLREQPWFEGRLATHGGSYLGFTQWALLMDPPPELQAAVISVAPHDFHTAIFEGGGFGLVDFLGWSNQVGHQEDGGFVRRAVGNATALRGVQKATEELPIAEAGERLLGGTAPWYREWVSNRDPGDAKWDRMKLSAALDRVEVPVLLQSGWQDIFTAQTMQQYRHLADRGVDVALTVGPWTHGELVTKGGRIVVPETLDWLDEHLAGSGVRTRAKPVKAFVTGAARQWRDLDSWPPPTADHVLHLLPEGRLGDHPAVDGTRATFTFDPADPTPTIGGAILLRGGYTDDSALPERADVLTFTGPVLSSPLEVLGVPVVELKHHTDNPHADLFVRISEVDADGGSRNVSDGFVRLDPVTANGSIRIELQPVAHRFAARNRIRLIIAGGSHPRWDRNLGTADNAGTSTRTVPSRRTMDLRSSKLVLPVGG